MPRGCESRRSNWTVHDRKLCQGRSREAEPESTTQTELSGCNDSEPHPMSPDNANREPSPCRMGEGCHVPLSNSCPAAQSLGGVSEGDRTGRAARVSRENSSGASETQPVEQGGNPTEPARAAGVVGVLRSSVDPSDSKTDGEPRRGTWVRVKGTRNGTGDGQGDLDINSAKSLRRGKVHCDGGRKPSRGSALGKPDAGKPLVRFDEGRSETVIGLVPFNPSAPPTLLRRPSHPVKWRETPDGISRRNDLR